MVMYRYKLNLGFGEVSARADKAVLAKRLANGRGNAIEGCSVERLPKC